MFDRIAGFYDLMNSVMTAGLHHRWRARAADLAALEPGGSALDVACGTGDLAIELARRVGTRGFASVDGFPRYAAHRGMAGLAAHLATGLDVRLDTMAFAVRPGEGGWRVTLTDGAVMVADALVLTCPVPQSASLLISAEVTVPEVLRALEYDRTIAVTLALDGPPAVPAPGGLQQPDETFSFVADNLAKGISAVPALTLHANTEWSLGHWDDDRDAIADALIAAASRFVDGRSVVARRVRRWRFATPQVPWPEPCLTVSERPPVVLAGDAFAGSPRGGRLHVGPGGGGRPHRRIRAALTSAPNRHRFGADGDGPARGGQSGLTASAISTSGAAARASAYVRWLDALEGFTGGDGVSRRGGQRGVDTAVRPHDRQRLVVLGAVEGPSEQLGKLVAGRARRRERSDHGQRVDALDQVVAGGLAELARRWRDVEDVVDDLEGHAVAWPSAVSASMRGRGAGRRRCRRCGTRWRTARPSCRRWRRGRRPRCGRRRRRCCSSRDLALAQPADGGGEQAGDLGAERGGDLRRPGQQEVAGEDRLQVAPPGVHALDAAAGRRPRP